MTRTHIRKQFLSAALTALLFVGAGVFIGGEAVARPLQLLGSAVNLECDWVAGETFGLGAFTQLAVNALKLIWGILGSLALAMFVWGGFLWLTARGEDEQIKKGWETLINAVIGLLIVLGSWVIINTIVLALTTPGQWKVAEVFGDEKWSNIVQGDICVKIAARSPSTGIGTSAAGAGGAGGMVIGTTGGCCVNQGFKPEGGAALSRMAIEQCVQFVASMSKLDTARGSNNETSAYFCPSIAPTAGEEICGSKTSGSGTEKIRWSGPVCNGRQVIQYAMENELCNDDLKKTSIKICQEPYVCDVNLGLGAGKRCIKGDEEVNCCVLGEAALKSDPTRKETYIDSTGRTTRAGCRSYSKTVRSGDFVLDSQVYTNARFKVHRMCNKDTECGGGATLFSITTMVVGCQILE